MKSKGLSDMSSILGHTHLSPQSVTPEMFQASNSEPTSPFSMQHQSEGRLSRRAISERSMTASEFIMPSLGIIDTLMADDSVNDILVNGTHSIYIDRDGRLADCGLRYKSDEEVWQAAERIMRAINQYWDTERPIIDTRLPDGSRVNIVGPPIAVDGVTISIRKFPKRQVTLDGMSANGQITMELAAFLKECTRLRMNIVVSGGTSTGKTTLLNALSAAIPEDERIVTIEDSAELRLQQPHVVRLESKPTRVTDKVIPEVTARDLVRNALRMRPDRIIVGESRGSEAFDVLQAMNTGHDGSMTTLHANSPRDALSRLETMTMVAIPNLTTKLVRHQIASALNLVLHIEREKDGTRHIGNVTEICGMEGDTIIMQDLMVYQPATAKSKANYKWSMGSPRTPELAEAARNAGLMKTL